MIIKQAAQTRPSKPTLERRLNHKLRERFDNAMWLLKPVLERTSSHDTRMYLMMERLQATYPDLSTSEIETLMLNVMRAHRKRAEDIRLVLTN
jgi:hypothetical protein